MEKSMHKQDGFTIKTAFSPSGFVDLMNIFKSRDLAYVNFTPELAKNILNEHNNQNRTINKTTVSKYAQEMQDGKWTSGLTDVLFNEIWNVLDGQHRLKAVIESQTSQVFSVKTNLPAEAFGNLDSGKKRSPSDTLGVNNFSNLAALSSIVRKYNHYITKKGNMWYFTTPCSNNETLALAKQYPIFSKVAAFVDSKKAFSRYGAKSDLGTCYAIFSMIDEKKADAFMDLLGISNNFQYQGINYSELFGSLRNHLVDNKMNDKKNGQKRDPHDAESRTFHYMFTAWNNFMKNEDITISARVQRDKPFVKIQNWDK